MSWFGSRESQPKPNETPDAREAALDTTKLLIDDF
jgi:hypothetical protein